MFRLKASLPVLFVFALLPSMSRAQANFIAPTPEELSMTSIPEVPGADAVLLNRDELDDDDHNMRSIYYRIKILSEKGVTRFGDVEIHYFKGADLNGINVGEVYARTIQPDGTIVPFTGKPQDKLLNKTGDFSSKAKVFSFPAVKVGSILEYRYTLRFDDNHFYQPSWEIQNDLFLRKGHFVWKPTDKLLRGSTRGGRETVDERLSWAKSLPPGVDVKVVRLPTQRLNLEVTVADVLPFLEEDHMPPIESSRYHVFFYYTPYVDSKEFWTSEFKYWNSDTKKFQNVTGVVRDQAQQLIAGATTDEQKARRLYAFMMTLENTDYTRTRTTKEEKEEIKSAEDVLKRKHGSSDEIALTYVALARAAGLDASSMIVTDRRHRILDPNWLDFGQLTDEIAIVKYDGADHFLDPGSRYAPFGHLEWDHTLAGGVRQDAPTDIATMFKQTPPEAYTYSKTSRIADVKLEADGHMTGTVTLTFEGSPALQWRQAALRNDEAEVKNRLRKQLQAWMPGGTEVDIKVLVGLENGEVPLKVAASIDGHIGSSVGARVLLPSALFEANRRPEFPHEKRDQGVYFSYSEMTQDAVRYTLPPGFAIESAPTSESAQFQKAALYTLKSTQTANSITLQRNMILGDLYFPLTDYPGLRTFYNDFEHKDHGSVVLKRTSDTAALETTPAAK
jgi:transglutaminase-like putative cysteine protease